MSDQSDVDYFTIQRALDEFDNLDWKLRRRATQTARMLVGRLRSVDHADYLRNLKRELRKFNMVTGEWDA